MTGTQATPRPWEIKKFPDDSQFRNQFFIAAPMTEDNPYFGHARFAEILADDNYPRKLADAELIVRCVNAHSDLVEALRKTLTCELNSDVRALVVSAMKAAGER